jgi:hypothetical protein
MGMSRQNHRLDGGKRTAFKSPFQMGRHLGVSTQNLQCMKVGENIETASKCWENRLRRTTGKNNIGDARLSHSVLVSSDFYCIILAE